MRTVVGIVGAGGIGEALARRRSTSGGGAQLLFSSQLPLGDVAARAGVIVVEGAGAQVLAAFESLRAHADGDSILVSSAPSVDLRQLREAAGPGPSIFRAVEIPAATSEGGMVILCAQDEGRVDAFDAVSEALSGAAVVALVPEDVLDSSAALARSALSLLTVALEGIEEGAVSAGLPPDTARVFTRQTLLTTALLLLHRGGSPADLKDQVASPAGTTIAGLAVLEEQGVRGAFIRAMERAARPAAVAQDMGRPSVVE
jgi:pyrroline-5-carboxylate reductase